MHSLSDIPTAVLVRELQSREGVDTAGYIDPDKSFFLYNSPDLVEPNEIEGPAIILIITD
jgi:hypothetical protein